jgi:hypothetical protein
MMNKPFTLDDVVEAIMIEEEKPAYEAMNRWVARYPQFKAELVSFFGTWAIQSEQPEERQVIDSESLASRGVSYALSLLDKRDAVQSILDCARAASLSAEQLATRTRLDDSILQKLNRRLITEVPRECIRLLATALGKTRECVVNLISGPPVLADVRYKAKTKPVAKQEDFVTAVRFSSLPADIKQDWLNIVASEKPDPAAH